MFPDEFLHKMIPTYRTIQGFRVKVCVEYVCVSRGALKRIGMLPLFSSVSHVLPNELTLTPILTFTLTLTCR